MQVKKCSKCEEEKNLSMFSPHKKGKFGKTSMCKQCDNIRSKTYRQKLNPDQIERMNERRRGADMSLESLETRRARKRRYFQRKYHSDPNYRLRKHMRERLRKALNGLSKVKSSFDLLGCSMEEFKIHLESLWAEGMSWNNYNFNGWHIDHVKPCAAFNLSDPEQQKECFYYTNLQPLWAKDNLRKGKTLSDPPQIAKG